MINDIAATTFILYSSFFSSFFYMRHSLFERRSLRSIHGNLHTELTVSIYFLEIENDK